MKFGLNLTGLGLRHIAEVARAAEANGFESVWASDHLVMPETHTSPYPYRSDGRLPYPPSTPMFDPWVVLTTVASATQSLRVGTNVLVLPLRHPFSTARMGATLDRMSQGRLTLGIGVGWMKEEFEAAQVQFEGRGRRTDEIIGILRRLWGIGAVGHDGEFYQFPPVYFEPKPSQKPTIPVEIGGTSPRALRRAARFGDGWIETGVQTLDGLGDRLELLADERRRWGREDCEFELTTSFARDLDTVVQCHRLGFTRALVRPPFGEGPPHETFLRWIPQFAQDVIRRVPASL